MLKQGDAFLLGNDPEGKLHLVLTAPDSNGDFLLVGLETEQAWSEKLVVLLPADYIWLKHRSVPAYRFARIENSSRFPPPAAVPRTAASAAAVQAILNGLVESDFTPNDVRQYALERRR